MQELDWEALEDMTPCEALRKVRPLYRKLVASQSEQEIEIDGRKLKMAPGSIVHFQQMVLQLERECASSQGRSVRRVMSVD